MIADSINLWTMVIFLIVGFITFLSILCLYGCEDGSCTFNNMIRCLCLICTCRMLDIGKSNKKSYTRE